MNRRLEMTGDRIEAVFAGHKIAGRVIGGAVVNRHSVVYRLAGSGLGQPLTFGQLARVRDEISLSLGVPVLIHDLPLRVRVFEKVTP